MKIVYLALVASLAAGVATGALAQAAGGGGRGGLPACADDSAKLCADQRGAARRTCLNTNIDKVSAACKAALAAAPAAPAGGGMAGPAPASP